MLLAGPPGAARDYFTISLWKSPVQIDLRTLRALGWGEPPTNKFFIYKPTPRSNFCLLAPAQFFTLQGFSDGVTIVGTPGGKHLGQGKMRSPRQISGWWLVWVRRQAAGHTYTHTHTHTHTHTYIHTHFHLYIGDFMYRILVCRSSHTSSTAERVRGAVHEVGPSLGVAAVAVAAAARRAHLVSAKETFQLLWNLKFLIKAVCL